MLFLLMIGIPHVPFQKIGSALNDIQFNFKSKRKTKHMEYWLIEK